METSVAARSRMSALTTPTLNDATSATGRKEEVGQIHRLGKPIHDNGFELGTRWRGDP